MSNLNVLNPFGIMRAFASGSEPPCQKLTMETIDVNNNKSTATNYVTLVDIQNMDSCSFANRKNPVTEESCKETFQSMDESIDPIYYVSLSLISLYMLFKYMKQ